MQNPKTPAKPTSKIRKTRAAKTQTGPKNRASRKPKREKKKTLLSFYAVGRPLTVESVADEFLAMRREIESSKDAKKAAANAKAEAEVKEALAKGEAPSSRRAKKELDLVEAFHLATTGAGTHALKLNNPNATGVIRHKERGRNRNPRFDPSSTNAELTPFQKVIFRPLEIDSRTTRSLVDHIIEPDEISERVLAGFASAFGEGSLAALTSGLKGECRSIRELQAMDFPVIFLPMPDDPEGGDLQVSPAPRLFGYRFMADQIQRSYPRFLPKDDTTGRRQGSYSVSRSSAHLQNASGIALTGRYRFHTKLPKILDDLDAAIYRYVEGGPFPHMDGSDIAGLLKGYVAISLRVERHSTLEVRRRRSELASRLLKEAADFLLEMLHEIERAIEKADRKDRERHERTSPDTPFRARRRQPPPALRTILDAANGRALGSDVDREIRRRHIASDHLRSVERDLMATRKDLREIYGR